MTFLNEQNGALAYVFGQPVLEVPQDLFIPPDALQIVLERFEGPLDLLLYLIRKQNLDVLDIPMAVITEQYLGYIKILNENRLDLAAEYLLMAAVLIEIKSRLLLPKPPVEVDEEADPRAELAKRLLAYEQMKLAAVGLDALPLAGRDFAWVYVHFEQEVEPLLPEVDVSDLKQVWLSLLSRVKQTQSHQVQTETLSVRAQMSAILRYVSEVGSCTFEALFEKEHTVMYLVVNFIAVLELVKEGLVDVRQEESFMPIYVSVLRAV
ncbi:segregation and condensation protein A [Neisseria sp. Ec49-e6-T10]|uniref:segregation and condensation protein A n=1 Tax=Neisseria sp. Ec49-e6-T10 TaxID=3140744 RepID=UPI003EC1550C